MSIAVFSAQYPPHMGGIETFTRNLAGALAARGCEVIVVTNDTNGAGAGLTREDGFDVMRLPCLPLVDGRLPLPSPSAERSGLIRQLRQRPLDGVLVNARFYPHSLLGMRLAREKGLRPLVLDHGSAWLSFSNRLLDPVVRLYERVITAMGKRYGAAYFGVSRKSAEWLGEFGIHAEGVITNSIDAAAYREQASDRDWREELRIDGSTFLVVFAGRLVPEKGLQRLLETFNLHFKNDASIHLAIAGSGPMERAASESGLDNCSYVGRLSQADLSALFRDADCLCLPTAYPEGLPTVLLEAAAQHAAIVVSDCAGAREVVPDDTHGIVLKELTPQTIAKALSRLRDDRDDLNRCKRNAAERVKYEFSWDKTAAFVAKLVEEYSKS